MLRVRRTITFRSAVVEKPPVRCGAAIADTVAPIVAVVGVLAELLRRAVTGTGD